MLEPLAATVLNSVLPTRPLSTHFFLSRSAFGMAVRTATQSLPHDFFTPHHMSVKGKGRALPEDERGPCGSSSNSNELEGRRVLSESRSLSPSASRTFTTRQRTRRMSGHKSIASGSGSHIPSLRTWSRHVHVTQRRHASSRPAVDVPRHPSPHPSQTPDERQTWLKTFKDVSQDATAAHPEDAWQAFESLRIRDGRIPGPPSLVLAFLANVTLSAMQDGQEDMSSELLHRWGKRLQEALHHIDPGIQDMPRNLVRVRWNGLFVAASAMLGRLDEAAESISMLAHHADPQHQDRQRGWVLEIYTMILLALHHYRGPRAVLNLLVEHHWVMKYLTGTKHPAAVIPDVKRFAKVARFLLSRIEDPVHYLRDSLRVLSKDQLSALGSLLIFASSRTTDHLTGLVHVLQRNSIRMRPHTVFFLVRELARRGAFDIAHELLDSVSPTMTGHDGRPQDRPGYHSTALYLSSREGDVGAADRHYTSLAQSGSEDLDDKAAYMHAYALAGQPTRAVELFRELFPSGPDSGPKQQRPNLVHYTTVMFAFSQAGDLDGVNRWLGELSRASLRPDLHVYSIILQSFASRGDIESMHTLLDQMRESNITPTSVIYTTLISTVAERSDPMAAERIYKRALDEGVVPDRQMVTSVMDAHVEAGSWHGVVRAYDYLNTAGRPGAGVTIEVFNTLMKAYVLIGAPFRVVANLFRRLGGGKLRPDARTFALLIQSACDSGFMDIAEELYTEMERLAKQDKQTALRANIYVLTIMMRGYLLIDRRAKAKAILERIKKHGLQPNAITYSAILKAYGDQGNVQGVQIAEEFLQSLMKAESEKSWLHLGRGRSVMLDSVFRPLLDAYVAQGNVFDVERIHQDMVEAGGEPTLGSITALLDVHRRTGNVEGVRTIWPEVYRLGLEYVRANSLLTQEEASAPSLSGAGIVMCVPLSIYMDALSGTGDHAEVARVWKQLKDEGLQFDSHNWNHLVVALVRAGQPHRAFDIVENVILKYQEKSRRNERRRDANPKTPLTLDLPPLEEGDIPLPRSEAPLHNARRRAGIVERTTRRLGQAGSLEGKNADDFAHPLFLLQQLSPVWNTWRPHGATLTLLGRVLDHLQSGRLVQAIRPGSDLEFEQAALDEKEITQRTEAAGEVLGGIYDAFPRTVRLVREYELMKRTSRRGTTEDSS
ncbi:hypothetical protein BV20DRAFT_1110207 [Pilatotrama ljubarskyi]|nr:hypothetical protein BV20DRAFT_1110207 [Pilatotrama ljubarskyi]